MKIEFVNHASFIIRSRDISLICDPWIDGYAFNYGWSLLSESKFEDFKCITHIWFSHEHPDHFSPPNLLKIPLEIRSKITILFQETTDNKVASFCRKLGFKEIIELEEDKIHELNEDFKILCNPYTDGDSYALFSVEENKLLNLNDCIVNTEERAKALFEKLGEIDILFTQFGYAHKVGNTEDTELRKQASKEKLQRIYFQYKYLKPKYIVPFASYVFFCHQENFYMNDGMNKINTVHSFIKNQTDSDCIVLYPGDIWDLNKQFNSEVSISKYLEDWENISLKELISSEPVDVIQLINKSKSYIQKLHSGFPKQKRFINALECNIHLSDINETFLLSGKSGLKKSTITKEKSDINMSSSSLDYVFKELWGAGTLNINARFQFSKQGAYWRFFNFTKISNALNQGENFPLPTPAIVNRLVVKIKKLLTKPKLH